VFRLKVWIQKIGSKKIEYFFGTSSIITLNKVGPRHLYRKNEDDEVETLCGTEIGKNGFYEEPTDAMSEMSIKELESRAYGNYEYSKFCKKCLKKMKKLNLIQEEIDQ
jgi:hypothetical protein